jgi:hypothetical protein
MTPAGLGPENDCAGEDQQQLQTTHPFSPSERLHKDYNHKRSVGKKYRSWVSRGWRQDELVGGKPPVLKWYWLWLWFEVLTAMVTKSTIFWDITSRSPLKSTGVSEEHSLHLEHRLSRARYQRESMWQVEAATWFTLVSCSAWSILKTEAICSSETSVDLQRTTRRYIPKRALFIW